MKLNQEKFIAGLHEYLQEQFSPVAARIKALEVREPVAPEKGETGEKGDDGAKGDPGADVDPEYLERLVGEKVAALPAPKDGATGEKGDAGEDVDMDALEELVLTHVSGIPAPKNGEDGKSVDIEEIKTLLRELVAELPAAKDGRDGESVSLQDVKAMLKELVDEIPKAVDGVNGKDGAAGRDALAVDILPAVDFEKSYPRGIYARHNGGVVRSYTQTDGERGWESVWSGVARVEVEQKDFRNFTIKTTVGDARPVEQTFTIPCVLDRGVYKADNDYFQGDATTFGGSLWVAQADNPEGKPGASKDWRLAVKHGRNGRDGENGEKGDKGDKGSPGKDGRDLTQMDNKGDKW